uniref:Putative secreted protein n=1 Tax=Ixodes ricinus TaxID=34613 RepID=A0A6B0U0Z5_IXORI
MFGWSSFSSRAISFMQSTLAFSSASSLILMVLRATRLPSSLQRALYTALKQPLPISCAISNLSKLLYFGCVEVNRSSGGAAWAMSRQFS